MKRILAIGAAAAGLMALSSAASAQGDCVNGWHMIKDQILARCDVLPSAFAGPPRRAELLPAEEPMLTGSIKVGVPPFSGREQHAFVASRDECQPGLYWMSSSNQPVACK
jgi:hypothetical protein